MIIDCHGHYTTAPKELTIFRDRQLAGLTDSARRPADKDLGIGDDQIREGLEGAQLKLQRERGTDLTIFSPARRRHGAPLRRRGHRRAVGRICNGLIHRAVQLYPENFVAVCQLPQVPGVPPEELHRRAPRAASPSWASSAAT